MADYISTHTGEEIDAAISAVIEKETTWDEKPSVDEVNTAIANATANLATKDHTQAASTITAGTLGGEVSANSSGQTVGNSVLRNSKLVSADTTPTVNGEIYWTYA